MIVNRTYVLDRADVTAAGGLLPAIEKAFDNEPLRWFISAATPEQLTIESTDYTDELALPVGEPGWLPGAGPQVVVSIVPTGIGCSIGGFAGDAGPATALLAQAGDYVVTNPNAVNASDFIYINDRVLYTEGSCVDQFCRGRVNLYRPRLNKIGVIIEHGDPAAIAGALNIVNTARAVYGVDIVDVVVTPERIGTHSVQQPSGSYVGTIERPEVLLDAARTLLERGATAIAVTSDVQNLNTDAYTDHFRGGHPNPVGGVEAIISHLLVRTLGAPAAHAPLKNFKDITLNHGLVDPRGAGEFVSANGLASVLIGLRHAPQIRPDTRAGTIDAVGINNVAAVVAPASALGGVPVLEAARRGIPVIAVADNTTILDVTADNLGLDGVIPASNYIEAAGIVLALRASVSLDSLRRPLASLNPIEIGKLEALR